VSEPRYCQEGKRRTTRLGVRLHSASGSEAYPEAFGTRVGPHNHNDASGLTSEEAPLIAVHGACESRGHGQHAEWEFQPRVSNASQVPHQDLDMPNGVDIGWVMSTRPEPGVLGLDLLFYRLVCSKHRGEIFEAPQVDQVP
jgi:hypothetical protein